MTKTLEYLADSLLQIIPTNVSLPSSGYFFYYSLIGNDVTNEVFFDISNPSFPPERASVKIRSSIEALRSFFVSQPGLQVSVKSYSRRTLYIISFPNIHH